jgi:ubiquinone/menaquinone biosynthesis C-methylase UbiE
MKAGIVNERKLYLAKAAEAALPWGLFYATSRNFQVGFGMEEGRLVAKYLNRPSNILIVGSGNGREARPICRDGHRIFCIDFGLLYLQSGRRLFSAEGCTNVWFVAADMRHLPFAENSFDFVFFSLFCAAHEARFDMMMRMHRLLRPAGHLLMTATTSLYPSKYGFMTIDTVDELCREVSTCPFEVLEGAVDPKRPDYLYAILRAIDLDRETSSRFPGQKRSERMT